MRVLITGVEGQLGWELDRLYVDPRLQGEIELFSMTRADLDLDNPDQICERIREIKPQLILNPAAYTVVDKAEQEPELAMRITPKSTWAIDSTFKTNQYGLPLYGAMCPKTRMLGIVSTLTDRRSRRHKSGRNGV